MLIPIAATTSWSHLFMVVLNCKLMPIAQVRSKMFKKLALLSGFLSLSSCPANAVVTFYSGAYDLETALPAVSAGGTRIFDDFDHQGLYGTLTSIRAFFLAPVGTRPTTLNLQIRTGVSAAGPGAVVFDQTKPVGLGPLDWRWVDSGISAPNGHREFWAILDPPVLLSSGRYWLSIAPDIPIPVQTTIGTNGLGSPLGNGDVLVQTGSAFSFHPDGRDLRFEVESTVPEPGSLASLGLGSIVLLRRRKRD